MPNQRTLALVTGMLDNTTREANTILHLGPGMKIGREKVGPKLTSWPVTRVLIIEKRMNKRKL